MNRRLILLVAVFIAGFVVFLFYDLRGRKEQPAEDLQAVPLGQTVTQTFKVTPDGEPETWKMTKRKVKRENFQKELLPAPDPKAAGRQDRGESARALNDQALNAWRTGEIRAALDHFEKAVQADPEDAEPRSNYGRLLTLMTDYERALPQLERAAELSPQEPQVWLDLQTLYERAQQFERANYARNRAEETGKGQKFIRDDRGFWLVEGKTFP